MADATNKVKLKLLIDKKAQRVVFAEARKDFVDFLFSLLHLPLGVAVRLLSKDSMAGCLPKLYQSIETIDESYLQPNVTKDSILRPVTPPPAALSAGARRLLPDDAFSTTPANSHYYRCSNCSHSSSSRYMATDMATECPECKKPMTGAMRIVKKNDMGEGGGYMKDMVTYMVMDDLTVKQATLISTIAVLNAANVKDFESLEPKDVELGIEEGLKLLEASLCSEAALTHVFLGKKRKVDETSEAVDTSWVNAEMVKMLSESE